eukprot:gb/GFBE01065859.1/.p1 GENE.gb/GFBE01065859.1/~~gb/GFBE01065859.1/.p1  ORF type:complete len:107 (+),score=12.16 gb/GFBE01065859.1/:1-321(+)
MPPASLLRSLITWWCCTLEFINQHGRVKENMVLRLNTASDTMFSTCARLQMGKCFGPPMSASHPIIQEVAIIASRHQLFDATCGGLTNLPFLGPCQIVSSSPALQS